MKRRSIILLCVAVAGVVLIVLAAWRGHGRQQSLSRRIADMKALLEAYRDVAVSNALPQMPDLQVVLERKNISLHNPIPKDRSLQSHRIVATAGADERTPDAVLVDETDNVRDAKLRVRGYADGSIRVERR